MNDIADQHMHTNYPSLTANNHASVLTAVDQFYNYLSLQLHIVSLPCM